MCSPAFQLLLRLQGGHKAAPAPKRHRRAKDSRSSAASLLPRVTEKRDETALALVMFDLAVERLRAAGLSAYFEDVEMPLVAILASMEHRGVACDRPLLGRYRGTLEARLEDTKSRAHALAGRPFSLASPKDLARVLYEELGLPRPAHTGRGRRPPTDKAALEALQAHHPLPAAVLRHRAVSHALTEAVAPLLRDAARDGEGAGYRVHATFSTRTATGRVTTVGPNLQCLPKPAPAQPLMLRKALVPREG